jgi:hypothetical protein
MNTQQAKVAQQSTLLTVLYRIHTAIPLKLGIALSPLAFVLGTIIGAEIKGL